MAKRYIADLHFGHKNILAYDNRPFTDIEAHDAEIMERWNNSVSENDDVFILGDVSWYSAAKTAGLMQRLNGTKHLIIGNHDGELLKSKSYRNCFQEIERYLEFEDEGQKIILCHYPILSFNSMYQGAWHFYGHVHSSFEENMVQHNRRLFRELYDKPCNMLNVGIMMPYMDLRPKTFAELVSAHAATEGYMQEGGSISNETAGW